MVKFLKCDDWMAMYVEGVLVLQDHSLSPEDVAEAILGRGEVEVVWVESIEDAPEHWEDVRR